MISVKIHGMDELLKELKDAQQALRGLDGTITTLSFKPSDEQSVNAAIQQMEAVIDDKTSAYRGNNLVMKLAAELKGSYSAAILERAASERNRAATEN